MAIDFASGISQAERQRKMAELLRARSLQPGPQGSMTGSGGYNHYVAPSIFQQMQPLANTLAANYQDKQATESEGESNRLIQNARQQWQSRLPQAVAAQAEQAGPVDPNNPQELEAQPGNPLTTGRILHHTLAGMEIPGNEKAAEIYNRGALSDLAREDTQTARREDLAANMAARLAQQRDATAARLEELKMRLEDRGLDRASREQMAREQRALTAQLDAGNKEIRRMAIEAKTQAAADKAKATGSKPVPQKVVQELSEASERADALEEIEKNYKPEFSGASGAAKNVAGTWIPGVNSDSANWWKEYNNRASLAERHAMFGTALSAGERQAWKDATISPGMTDEVIKHNLQVRARLAAKMYDSQLQRQAAASGGNYDVGAVFQPRTAAEEPAKPPTRLKFNPATGALE